MDTMVAIDVQPRAQAALTNSPFYELRELLVEHRDGALVISGCVTSFYHKQLAQEVVRSVCAGIEVVNSIHVELDEKDGINQHANAVLRPAEAQQDTKDY